MCGMCGCDCVDGFVCDCVGEKGCVGGAALVVGVIV